VLKLGTVALDGTKLHANASRHSALSWKRACEIEVRLQAEVAEVAELMALAEAADGADVPDGMSVPEELARREDRLARIAEAKATIEARARERHERELGAYREKLKAREEKARQTGRKPGGRAPKPPVAGPAPKDQVNLTDADSRIMPVAGGGFEQAYNAQATVASGSLLVVTNDVVQATNDKREIEPALEALARLPEALGRPETLLADSGYFSEANVNICAEAKIVPLIAPGREHHHLSWKDRFAAAATDGDAAGSDGASTGDARGPATLRLAQTDAGTGVWDHQIGDGLPAVPPARPRQGKRRMEPRHPGLEREANVRLAAGLKAAPSPHLHDRGRIGEVQ